MTTPAPAPTPDRPVLDTDASDAPNLVGKHTRTDTLSSVGSAKTLPEGHWKLNLSGNCPVCHHHNSSITVHVRASNNSNHVGDISCDHCDRLWLDFGKRTSTRTSLLSNTTIEPPEPSVSAFRIAIIEMMRSATAAALSPTLTDIPEASSAGPSRETSVRSTSRSVARGLAQSADGPTLPSPKEHAAEVDELRDVGVIPPPSGQKGTQSPRFSHHKSSIIIRQVKCKLRKLQKSFLGRFYLERTEMSPKQKGKQPVSRPTLVISTAIDIAPETGADISNDAKVDSIDVCTPSSSAKEAIDSLTRIDKSAIQALTPEERDKWVREQITAFKIKFSKPTRPMVDNGTQADLEFFPYSEGGPPSRPPSLLRFLGSRFGDHESWHSFRGPLNVSETHLSEADTAVEGVSDSAIPRHILVESLQRNRRGSGSPRPRSIQSFVRSSRAENRWSLDSNATGAAVRSITSGRGRTLNRLSRSSLARSSQTQLAPPTNEAPDLPNGLEQEQLNSGSPPTSPLPSPRLT